jgi:cellulose biosynthesis protein BcsQ
MSFLSKLLGVVSGNNGLKISDQLLFDKIIGFRGIVPGVGTSTIVQNVAYALSETTNFAVCVLDTAFMYSTQYPMLVSGAEGKRKDFLDFSGDLSAIITETDLRNVYLLSLSGRTVVDMMSSKDSELTVNNLIGALKTKFDIILVDLSYEFTNITIQTAIKCNKIVNVADQSLKCIYNMRKSLNTMATLAIPLAKANKVVFNKVIPDVLSNTKSVIQEAGLTIVGEIPFALDIAKQGVAGKRVWASVTSNQSIHDFSVVINTILDGIIQTTPLNAKYTDKVEVEKAKQVIVPVGSEPSITEEIINSEEDSSEVVIVTEVLEETTVTEETKVAEVAQVAEIIEVTTTTSPESKPLPTKETAIEPAEKATIGLSTTLDSVSQESNISTPPEDVEDDILEEIIEEDVPPTRNKK